MNKLDKINVVGVGEVLWDCFADIRRPGGAPANVAFHANQLGCHGLILSCVGRDSLGDDLLSYFRSQGLDARHIQRDPHRPTGTIVVDTSQIGSPRYTIAENAAWDHLAWTAQWEACFSSASAVCFGTLAQRCLESRSAIHRGLDQASRALLVFDVNLRPPWYGLPWIKTSLVRANVVKLNHDEVSELSRLLDLPASDPKLLAKALMDQFDVRVVVITRAERGCLAFTRDETVDVAGQPVDLVDAVGAGDAFTAALIRGLLANWPLATTVRFANAVGALVASHPGAMPNLSEELHKLEIGVR